MEQEQRQSFEMLKEVYEEKEATINGRVYKLLSMTHQKRKKVFAFYTSIQNEVATGNYSFIGLESWDTIEEIINNHVMLDNDIIAKVSDHFDKYPEDYVIYSFTMLGAMSIPFLPESLIN